MENQKFDLLKKFIITNPLIVTEPTLAALKPSGLTDANASLFFGVGIVSLSAIAAAVPFDILAMFLVSEHLRRVLGFKKVNVLIADTHALANHTFSETEIQKIAKKVHHVLDRLVKNLELSSFKLILGSELAKNQNFKKILSSLPETGNEYLKLEIADSLFFQKHERLKIKIGWTMSKNNQKLGCDERFFDQEIKKFCPELSFIHLKPGRTFDKIRPRVSPYLATAGENRILLTNNENVTERISAAKEIWQDKHLGGALRHLTAVARSFEMLFGKLPVTTVEEKITFIINKSINS